MSNVVAVLGSNYIGFHPYSAVYVGPGLEPRKTSGLIYEFAMESVTISTTADIDADPVSGRFVSAGAMVPVKLTNAQLKFYIVSDAKVEGGKFIDTPSLPKVGYIAPAPDLVVTTLQDVWRAANAGEKAVAVSVELTDVDKKRFGELTEKALEKRLLVSLGDTPLTAPRVLSPIKHGRFVIEFLNEAEAEKTMSQLRKLVAPK